MPKLVSIFIVALTRIVSIGLFIILLTSSSIGQDAKKKEIAKKLRTSFDQYLSKLPSAKGDVELWQDGNKLATSKFSVKGKNTLLMASRRSKAGEVSTAEVYNSQYSFLVSRKSEQEQWSVNRIVLARNFSEKDIYHSTIMLRPSLLTATSIANIPIYELVADKSTIVSLVDRQVDGKATVTVISKVPLECRPSFLQIDCVINIDTSLGVVDSALVNYKSGNETIRETVQNEFLQQGSVKAIRSSRSETLIGDRPPTVVEFKFAYDDSSPKDIDFTLTAFGLPEPPGTTVLNTSFPVWAISTVLAVVFIGMGFYFKRLASMTR